jgi:magnesium-transporting ATPase (P-type)
LVYAIKEITEDKINAKDEEIEADLRIVGVTAVEDLL